MNSPSSLTLLIDGMVPREDNFHRQVGYGTGGYCPKGDLLSTDRTRWRSHSGVNFTTGEKVLMSPFQDELLDE